MNKTRKLTLVSMLIAISIIIYKVEFALPSLDFIAPGVKLGLSNVITLACLYIFGAYTAFVVLVIRVFISSLFFGGVSAMLYSLVGSLSSLAVMLALKKINLKSISILGISMAGSFFFNIGQLIVAAFIIQNNKIFYYLPYVSIMSMLTGIFVGLTAIFFIDRLQDIMKYQNMY